MILGGRAKTWVIDGEWAVVGSANLDHLSLFVNLELVLAARDPDLGEALRAQDRGRWTRAPSRPWPGEGA